LSNLFNTINIGLKGLQAQKKSLDTTSHNISNANTEGYSRQRAVHSTTDPYTVPGMGMPEGAGQVGTGVEISEINRIKDQFIEGQIREKKQSQSYWNKKSEGLSRIENILNEPSDNNLSAAFDRFWQSLQDLSNNPEDSAVRSTVKERAKTLVDSFHSLEEQLTDYKKSLNKDVETTINEINSLGKRIADLNKQIAHIKGAGKNPNDLMDTRDKLIEELNQKVNVRTREIDLGKKNNGNNKDSSYIKGNINISIGGMSFVNGDSVNELKTVSVPGSPNEDSIEFEGLGRGPKIKSGELDALLELRGGRDEEIIPNQIDELDKIAKTFAEEFNKVHNTGYDLDGNSDIDFFESDSGGDITARSINITSDIEDGKIAAGTLSDNQEVVTANVEDITNYDPSKEYVVEIDETTDQYEVNLSDGTSIASGTISSLTNGEIDLESSEGLIFKVQGSGSAIISKNSGSGNNASNLSDVIKNKDLDFNEDGTKEATVMDKYESVISSLGVQGQRANQMVENQDTLVNQLENRRQSISGVSLDEEMANMIKYQQAYSASAKLISNANRMMDSLMGILR